MKNNITKTEAIRQVLKICPWASNEHIRDQVQNTFGKYVESNLIASVAPPERERLFLAANQKDLILSARLFLGNCGNDRRVANYLLGMVK